MAKSSIFIISGPSGSGQDSVIEGLEKFFPLERVITTVTRPMRPGESQGHPYHFISQDEFKKRIAQDGFVEYAQHYNDNYYGVESQELERVSASGKIGIWKMDYKGVMTAKEKYPDMVSILINAPSLEILENRIRLRDNASDEYIKERMEYTKEWMKHLDIYDHVVINDDGKLGEAVQQVAEIIRNCQEE